VAVGGGFVAVGYANPRTSIAIRVLSLADEPIDTAFVGRRVDEALALRAATLPASLASFRVLNGEGDRLPDGLLRQLRAVGRDEDVLEHGCFPGKGWSARAGQAIVSRRGSRVFDLRQSRYPTFRLEPRC